MSSVFDIVNGVAALLSEYDAEVMFAPSFELRKMQSRRVVVMPTGKERKFQTRSSFESGADVAVAVIHKCRDEESVPELIALVELIGDKLLGARVGNSICIHAKWAPLYSVDELRTKALFISVIEFTFKESAA